MRTEENENHEQSRHDKISQKYFSLGREKKIMLIIIFYKKKVQTWVNKQSEGWTTNVEVAHLFMNRGQMSIQ